MKVGLSWALLTGLWALMGSGPHSGGEVGSAEGAPPHENPGVISYTEEEREYLHCFYRI